MRTRRVVTRAEGAWAELSAWARGAYWREMLNRLQAVPVGDTFKAMDLQQSRKASVTALLRQALKVGVIEVAAREVIKPGHPNGRGNSRVTYRRVA